LILSYIDTVEMSDKNLIQCLVVARLQPIKRNSCRKDEEIDHNQLGY